MNIILVVIISEYGNTKNAQKAKDAEDAANQPHVAIANNNENTNSEKGRENSLLSSPGRGGHQPKTTDHNALAETMKRPAEGSDVPKININESQVQTGRQGNDHMTIRIK